MELVMCGEGKNISGCSSHKHGYFEVVITTDGQGMTVAGDVQIPVSRGSVVIVPPEVSHRVTGDGLISDLFIQMDDVYLPDEVTSFRDATGEMLILGKMICTNFVQKEKNYKEISQYLTGAFYGYAAKYCENEPKYEFVGRFKNILARGVSDSSFSIPDEAKKLGVSFEYLRHCFKEETGKTPLMYLTSLRVRQAKRYFSTSRFYSVAEVAALCGFSDPYYFSRCFKKYTGLSPYEYKMSAK